MKKDEKEGLIGLAIIAAVLLVGGYFIYKIFFTYGSYAECVGDRTLKPGMSNQQVSAQKRYCRDYFTEKLSKREIKKRDEKYNEWLTQNKARIRSMAMNNCVDRFGNWLSLEGSLGSSFKIDKYYLKCSDYKHLDTNLRKD